MLTSSPIARFRGLALAVGLALVLAACGSSAASSTPVPSGPIDLAGTSWRLVDYISADGTSYTVPMAVTPLAAFDATTMSGNAGCNTFTAPYTVNGDTFKAGPVASTMMACEEPMASVETAYLAALDKVNRVAFLDDGRLQLWDAAGKTTLAFTKAS